jgi:tryptophanyl-tRNA synthetase
LVPAASGRDQSNYEEVGTMTERVLSGIRATGRLHFGNFMGAVRNFVKFQDGQNTCLYFIADWHTLTTLENPREIRDNLLGIVKDYLAAGLDPERSIIYAQSSVPEIAELSLYLGMIQPLGHLERTPTFKDMVRRFPNNVNLGTVSYPVLMAADILGPKSTLVPVGEDQEANVELARDLAQRFNQRFSEIFVIPEMMAEMVRIPGLDGNKMGKSEADNAIDISSDIETIRDRYRTRGITDPQRVRATDPGDPEGRCLSVYPLHKLITPGEQDNQQIAQACRAGTLKCVDCKNLLVDSIAQILLPFQEKRRELADKDSLVRDILHEGGKKARVLFSETTAQVRDAMGIVRY